MSYISVATVAIKDTIILATMYEFTRCWEHREESTPTEWDSLDHTMNVEFHISLESDYDCSVRIVSIDRIGRVLRNKSGSDI